MATKKRKPSVPADRLAREMYGVPTSPLLNQKFAREQAQRKVGVLVPMPKSMLKRSKDLEGELLIHRTYSRVRTRKGLGITANDAASFKPYTGLFQFGINQGYYPGWSAQQTIALCTKAKGYTLRIPLYDEFLTMYGVDKLVPDFDYAISQGCKDILAFIGWPHNNNRDQTILGDSPVPTNTFRGLYEPIWLDTAETQINPANTYANYLFKMVPVYAKYVKFWEVVNEPDFTFSQGGWLGDIQPENPNTWFQYDPKPSELFNLRTYQYQYGRMLEVAYKVIKKLSPDSYICTGGIGYRSFLDSLLRTTPNPDLGKVTAQHPLKSGAYFDFLSFHTYPMYYLKKWVDGVGEVFNRHSDAAIDAHIQYKMEHEKILAKYGYDGVTYPKKQFICTETNVSTVMDGVNWGSEQGAVNYLLKCIALSPRYGILQNWFFKLGNDKGTDQFSKMGLYNTLDSLPVGQETLTRSGYAHEWAAGKLRGYRYDEAATKTLLGNQSGINGAAFKNSAGALLYMVWAKTTTDMMESAATTITLPAGGGLYEKEVVTGSKTALNQGTAFIDATPCFIYPVGSGPTPPPDPQPQPGPIDTSKWKYTGKKGYIYRDGKRVYYGWFDTGIPELPMLARTGNYEWYKALVLPPALKKKREKPYNPFAVNYPYKAGHNRKKKR